MPDVDPKTSTGGSQSSMDFSFSLRRFALAIFFASIPLAVFCSSGMTGVIGGVIAGIGLFLLTLRPGSLTVGLFLAYFIWMFLFDCIVNAMIMAGSHSPFNNPGDVLAIVFAATIGWFCCALDRRFLRRRKL